ncbi:MAG: 1-acyl-sn-glycerol-3-phosphate acyltransferase [Planctomycetes bacterium]|nr:1-acyl-sn-glycerol-3-phosphate acyltransferase [Planctomycetota bacterium]
MSVGRVRVHPLEPTGPLEDLLHGAVTLSLRTLLRTLWRVSCADVPTLGAGPSILAPNHRSFLDPIVVGSMLEERITFMMTAKYYDRPGLRRFFRMERCLVVETDGDNRRVLRDAKAVLDAGRHLCIFPEGAISPDGRLQPPQLGVAWLARRTGAPVFPIFLGGTREALPRGAWVPRFPRVTMRVGGPLSITEYAAGRAGDERFSHAVMTSIARLGRTPARR